MLNTEKIRNCVAANRRIVYDGRYDTSTQAKYMANDAAATLAYRFRGSHDVRRTDHTPHRRSFPSCRRRANAQTCANVEIDPRLRAEVFTTFGVLTSAHSANQDRILFAGTKSNRSTCARVRAVVSRCVALPYRRKRDSKSRLRRFAPCARRVAGRWDVWHGWAYWSKSNYCSRKEHCYVVPVP